MDLKVLDASSVESTLKEATFAGGCFWGLELAFQRAKGVVSTKVFVSREQNVLIVCFEYDVCFDF